MIPTILLLASPLGLTLILAGAALALTAMAVRPRGVPVRLDERDRARSDRR